MSNRIYTQEQLARREELRKLNRRRPEVKAALAANAQRWRDRHPEKAAQQRARQLERYHTEPGFKEKRRASAYEHKLKTRYGLTAEGLKEMHAKQESRCALPFCRKTITLGGRGMRDGLAHVDHCHATGRVRGLLCGSCNTALGRLGDSIESIAAVLAYVKGEQS